jgi:hypothetical protein
MLERFPLDEWFYSYLGILIVGIGFWGFIFHYCRRFYAWIKSKSSIMKGNEKPRDC